MNTGVDTRLMESLSLNDMNDFNSIEIENIQIQEKVSDPKISDISTIDDKLIVISNESENPDESKLNEVKYDTLHESVYDTIKRDILNVLLKVKFVLNPFLKDEEKSKQLRNWDLWGPLIFTIILSLTLSYDSNEKGSLFVLIFTIIWFGSIVITFNGQLLGAKISMFQFICLLGYCMFPLNISAIVFKLIIGFNEFLKLIVVVLACVWSTYSSIGFIKHQTVEDKKHLVLYPIILFYLFLSCFVLMNQRKS